MDLTILERFVEIAERGSYRAAAEALFVAQPALSRQMKRLESELEVTLFDRGRWGLRLTPQGEALLPFARRLISDAQGVRAVAHQPPAMVLRVGAAATAIGSFLAPFLAHWAEDHSGLRIKLIEDGAVGLRRRLQQHECDVALLAEPVPTGFSHRVVKAISVQALLPTGHPLAASTEPLSVSEFADEPVLVNAPGFLAAELFHAACKLSGVVPAVTYESSVGQTLAALAENNVGIAILADSVDLRGFDLQRRPLCTPDGRPIQFILHVAWREGLESLPGAQQFVDEIADFVAGVHNHA